QLAAGETRAVEQAGVVELVLYAEIATSQQALQRAEIGQIAGAEHQRARIAEPVGEFLLQLPGLAVVATELMPTAGADAVPCGGFLQRGDAVQVTGQAEIIVAAEVDQGAAVDLDAGAVARIDHTATAPKCGLGAVRLLAQQSRREVGPRRAHAAASTVM